MQSIHNKVLITGGSSGIGLALAGRFREKGNQVVIAARNPDKLEQIKAALPGIYVFACDLTRQEDLDSLAGYIKQEHPDLNLLINNAGIQYNYDFLEELDIMNKIEYEISANLTAVIKLCGLLLPVLVKNGSPAIVNVSSGLALSPKRSAPVYCATKSAIHQFTKALRYQVEPRRVKVFEILPALVDTPMTTGRGKNKMSPEKVVTEFMSDFEADRYESYIGKTKILRLINRFSPALADRILKNG